jgi:hypothetical protein
VKDISETKFFMRGLFVQRGELGMWKEVETIIVMYPVVREE